MIDSHCHLDHEPLVQNIEDILVNCKKEGVQKLLTISTTLNGFPKILEIIEKDEMIFGTFGIHPHETNNDQVSKDEIIKKINTNNKIIGVGETGLDFYYNNSDKDKQIRSFKNHIDAALELDIPLIVHSRNAEDETYEILKNIKEGDIVENAIVKATTDWGIFLDINGVDALLHVSDLSHGRVKKPSDLVTIGQKIKVKINGKRYKEKFKDWIF